jgi:hypothetical protein
MPEPETTAARSSRSLAAAILEGVPSEAFLALATGSALTAWALHLGADPLYLSALQSLLVGAQILHGFAAAVSSRRSPRRVAKAAVLVSRLAWAPMIAVPFLDLPHHVALAILFGVAMVSAVGHVFLQNSNGTWLGGIVPSEIRGRFFASRSRVGTAAVAVAAFVAALLLDHEADPADDGVALSVLAALACAAGIGSVLFMRRMPAPEHTRSSTEARSSIPPDAPAPPGAPGASAAVTTSAVASMSSPGLELAPAPSLLETFRDRRLRPLLAYQLVLGAAISPGTAFFSLWLLDRLSLPYMALAGHALVIAVTRALVAPLWGRAVDRFGARPVLVLSTLGVAAMPLLWMASTPDFLWPLVLDAMISGALWGGQQIAMFDLPLRASAPRARPQALAAVAMMLGVGWIAGSWLFGALASVLTAHTTLDEPLRVVFLLSAIGRASCALLALHVTDERAQPVSALARHVAMRVRPA